MVDLCRLKKSEVDKWKNYVEFIESRAMVD